MVRALATLIVMLAAVPAAAQEPVRFGPFAPDVGVAEAMRDHPEYAWRPVYKGGRGRELVGAKAGRPLAFGGYDWTFSVGAAEGIVLPGQRYDFNMTTGFGVAGERDCRQAYSDLIGKLETLYARDFGNHPAFRRNGNTLYLSQDFKVVKVGERSIARDKGEDGFITFLELDEATGTAVRVDAWYSDYDGEKSCNLRLNPFGDDDRIERARESRRPGER